MYKVKGDAREGEAARHETTFPNIHSQVINLVTPKEDIFEELGYIG